MSFLDKMTKQKFLSATLVVFTLAIGIVIGSLAQTGVKAQTKSAVAPDATPLVVPNAVQMQSEFTKVAKMLEPTVVNISSEYIPEKKSSSGNNNNRNRGNNNRGNRRRQQQDDDDGDDDDQGGNDFFQRFFGGPFQQQPDPSEQRSGSLGSGVVVDKNGYILTNNHVVEKANRIKVKFMNDDTEYPATVIGTDTETDLAVIHVDRKNLAFAKIGNSDALQPGDWTIAIGSPFGFAQTVTAGIVSALSRDLPPGEGGSSFQHFIQTDAAINPGNSGGPLANINGELIGINTMIASRSGGFQGIGFAMPSNVAVRVYNEIIKNGLVTRGSIGITFPSDGGERQQSLMKVYGADHGIFVQTVVEGGPAEKAGVKAQDVITAINGKEVRKGQDLIDLIAESPVESTVKLSIMRDKKPMTLSVVIADRAKLFGEKGDSVKKQNDGPAEATEMKFGLSVQSLRQSDRSSMNFKGKGGVLVASVEAGSFADDIGMVKGDIIVELNRQEVGSPEDIRKIQGTLKSGDAVAFHVMRRAGAQRGDWQDLFLAGTAPQQ